MKKDLTPELFLKSLVKSKVGFILTGGYAVNFHGYNRSTSDMDIWIKPTEDNKKLLLDAMIDCGFSQEELIPLDSLDFTKPFSFAIALEPISMDVFNSISGVEFEMAEKNMIPFEFAKGLMVNFLSLTDLMLNKLVSGRPIDKADVQVLQEISRNKKKN